MSTAFDSTFGVDLIGGYVTAILYGIFCLQCHIFFRRFQQKDATSTSRVLKYSIFLLWFLNTLHLVLIIHFNYWYMVTNFANVNILNQVHPWSTPLFFMVTPTTNLLVKSWLVYRVWIMSSKKLYLSLALALGVAVAWGFGLAFSIELYILPTFASYDKENWMFYTEFTVETITDLGIASALCWYLYHRRSRAAFRHTYTILNFLLVYTVNTGLLTSILCLVSIIARIVQPNNFYFFASYMILSGLYSNALLGSLNARDWFLPERSAFTIPLSNLTNSSSQQSRNPVNHAPPPPDNRLRGEGELPYNSIQVDTEVIKAEL